MTPSEKKRWMILGLALAATIAASLWAESPSENQAAAVVKPREKHQAESTVAARGEELPKLADIRSPAEETPSQDLFKTQSWYVPPPPPKKLPPPPPSPPPLPYSYMGKMQEDGKWTVFLSTRNKNYIVKEGDTIDGAYQVEQIAPPLLTLIYTPLNMKQIMQIGGTN
jgi:hypothetical protein